MIRPEYGTPLTYQELRCVTGAATGASNSEIAARLHISPNTVKTHLRSAFVRLGATDRAHAAILAVAHGYLHIADRAGTLVPGQREAS